MNSLIEKALQPVSADDPCGPDLYYDPRFEELENILKGKPEVEIGSVIKPAEPPDWAELRAKSAEFLRASKHLRPAAILACSMLKQDGLPGFLGGLELVHGLLEKYWPDVHPKLDPDDNNDPQERLNIISVLTTPRGSTTGWLQTIESLHNAPLCQPKGVPPITLEMVKNAAAPVTQPAEEGGPKPLTTAILATQFRNAPIEQITANHEAVQQALEWVEKIDSFLITTLGTGGTISFEELLATLKEIQKTLAAYLPAGEGGEAGGEAGQAEDGASAPGGFSGIAVSGSIRNRGDVIRTLDHLCDYYRQVEPGSPVPYLLRRAQRLANMDFVQAMEELSLATVDQLRPSLGSAIDAAAASEGETSA